MHCIICSSQPCPYDESSPEGWRKTTPDHPRPPLDPGRCTRSQTPQNSPARYAHETHHGAPPQNHQGRMLSTEGREWCRTCPEKQASAPTPPKPKQQTTHQTPHDECPGDSNTAKPQHTRDRKSTRLN